MLNRERACGFGLIELMVAVSILAILGAVALPNLVGWIRNARMRTVADALLSGVRLAQAEAQRRMHTVVFFRTDSKNCTTASTASKSGPYWQIRVVPDPLQTDDAAEAVQCGVLTDVSSGVLLSSKSTALCFGGDGRQATLADPGGVGVSCTAVAARYDVTLGPKQPEDRSLRLVVTLAGSIRLCDPDKSASAPDGCR
ncbi:type IV fimbrial biogenesis protein FimT [Pelomonas saccharophila]|uniref:Type II secretion system protein H n=1 Tax=Roseateles saccharophilus TaxID=304 RepID=A0ABU1YR38_ROSSA|nr:GspH/FimT family pseudopilin [Roseateles saccharophilus]MDR7271321.1 type IV fimbrial biogenesis protein FimT [Roseateles saccharophilus]